MTGICGWIGKDIEHKTPEILQRMSARLPPGGEPRNASLASTTGALCVVGAHADLCAVENEGLSAAIEGSIRWETESLAETGRESGDAHALLRAYRMHGVELLRHLRGSFALAIIDSNEQQCLLAVDRMGVRPLCYSVRPRGVVFSSTANSVREHPWVSGGIDPQGILHYAWFHVIPAPGTIFDGVCKLEPAEWILFRRGRVEHGRHWTPVFDCPSHADEPGLAKELHSTLRAAVRRNDRGSSTGTFLSGGTDSSAVAGMLSELHTAPVRSFVIGFDQRGYDEIGYARLAARHYGIDLHEYYVTPEDIANALPGVARAYDEPFGNSSAIPAFFCARLAREQGVEHMLAGDGGDELFGGNARYATQKLFELYSHVPERGRFIIERALALQSKLHWSPLRKLASYVDQARVPMPDRLQTYNILRRASIESVFQPDFLERVDPQGPSKLERTVYALAPSRDLLDRMLYYDWRFTLADNDLRKVNRMCEHAGVTVAFPFLDEDVVALANRVPPDLKLKGYRLRYFYKRSMRGFLPRRIIEKPKHGFGLPFGEWLLTSPRLANLAHEHIQALKQRPIFRATYLDELVTRHREEHAAYYGTMVWVLAMLEQWLQVHELEP